MSIKKLAVGTYTASEAFKSIKTHIAVMLDNGSKALVASTGRADDEPENIVESFAYAKLFAASPVMLEAVRKIYMTDPRSMEPADYIRFVQNTALYAYQEACQLSTEEANVLDVDPGNMALYQFWFGDKVRVR